MVVVSVAICTWNRASLLRRTLERFCEVAGAMPVSWELLVVDNNSTDDTQHVLAEFANRLPLRTTFERVPGLAVARNTAVRETTGQYILWTDDDVIVNERWMPTLLGGFQEQSADWVMGRSRASWEAGVPDWFSSRLAGYFALLDYGDEPFIVTDKDHPSYGLNFGCRRDALLQLGPFRADLGPRETGGGGGEDTEMFERALAAGMRICYLPAAEVLHIIPPERSTKQLQRRKAWGAHQEYYDWLRETAGDAPRIAGIPRYMYRYGFQDVAGYCSAQARRDPATAFFHELRLLRFAGVLYEAGRRAAQQLLGQSRDSVNAK
ncbi:MAG: glycosyltransferase [Actinomycetota bacterium]|nr:glycosyltransferase [Actinomycetota bacterium]